MSMELTYSKGYTPVKQTALIKPIEMKDIPNSVIREFYYEDDLTEYEILILELIGMINIIKGGLSILSFQGLKRLLNLHQAKLTKALNRLIQKNLLEKIDAAYRLSDEGSVVFDRIYRELHYTENRIPNLLYSHVVRGRIIGIQESLREIRKSIASKLMGKWFGNYRFITMVEYDGFSEVCWMSTDGKTSISLLLGPENELSIVHSSPRLIDAETELQILFDRISLTVEEEMGLIIELSSLVTYSNHELIN